MNTRFFLGIGLAFALVLAAGIAAVVEVTSATEHVGVTEVPVAEKVPAASLPGIDSNASTPAPTPAATPSAGLPSACTVTALPTSSMPDTVLPSDIDSLASAIKLNAPVAGDVGKDVWARELPVAQRLLTGMCDCDQRNWLKHFISTGQEALAGSSDYAQSVQLLATLRRANHPPLTVNP